MQNATYKSLLSYRFWYFIALFLLVGSLPLSKFTMSLFQFGTLFFWLWHGVDNSFIKPFFENGKFNAQQVGPFIYSATKEIIVALYKKFLEFFKNKAAMVLASVLLMHVLGLLYTTDFHYALKDLRTKLPIFILPLFIATGPRLSTKQFYIILGGFVAAVIGGTFYQTALYLQASIADTRAIWAHISHIRFSLNSVFAFFILIFFIFSSNIKTTAYRYLLLIPAIWIAGFLFYYNYTTGMIMLPTIASIVILFYVFKIKSKAFKYLVLSILSVSLIFLALYFYTLVQDILNPQKVYFSQLENKTNRGNYYYHDTVNFKTVDGKWEGLYICDKELREEWAKRSNLNLDSLDVKKQVRRHTLIRYLASKGVRKDKDGMDKLTNEDIARIEKGINSTNYASRKKIRAQLEDFLTGLQNYHYRNNPNEGSLIQRFEYWRTSLQIIHNHPVVGVGTGDIPEAFRLKYIEMNSQLSPHNRHRSHNQYLSIGVGFGIIGLIWFLFALLYPGIKTKGFNNYFYSIYWIILMVSMLTEDTIESQEGATFFALFTSLMLFSRAEIGEKIFRKKRPEKETDCISSKK